LKIRLLTSISAAHGSFSPGEETDWPDKADAERLVKAGFAEKVSASRRPKVEKATKAQVVEKATT
jgi:hypothetical protein